ncbi:phospholipase B1, membrane-associated-like [Ischnura elegans]|uniref:phospholipase B1, membrane-associated-like n=1 Tax=Ischnura elegans TaxID=197161 RepID=UPI001ED888DA|nr:phospholipase B1, membrane-associated-like [Ischnura elegans]
MTGKFNVLRDSVLEDLPPFTGIDTRNLRYPQNNPYREPIQDRIPPWIPHPCEVDPEGAGWRSESRPTTVHKLRPGDIDVIAAIGDSLTAGNSAREIYPFGVIIQDRGVSMTGGGVGTWREITTLPNLIKIFNPNVIGFAKGRGDFLSYNAQLNVAIPSAIDDDIHNQVRLLIKKMKRDKRIDFNNDWKLLTILIGHNDLCSYHCFDREKHSSRQHFLHLQKALDYLYKHVPKMYVNLLSILDPTISARIPSSLTCEVIRRVFCSCLYVSPNFEGTKVNISSQVREYQAVEEELTLSGRYEGREDFAVTFQPFPAILNGPTKSGEPENPQLVRYLMERLPIWTKECFHLNQRGLATASILLWNNMLEPVGAKSRTLDDILIDEYKCPTTRAPYFFTNKNSETFYWEGYQ